MDVSVNGNAVATALPVGHLLEGTEEDSDPRIQWVQLHLRAKPSAAEGGAYIDSLSVSKGSGRLNQHQGENAFFQPLEK